MNSINKLFFTLTLLISFLHIIPSYSVWHGRLMTQYALTALIQHPGFTKMLREQLSTKPAPPKKETPKKSVFEEDLKSKPIEFELTRPKKSVFELNLNYPFQKPKDRSKSEK